MKVISWQELLNMPQPFFLDQKADVGASIGVFDGVHRGHTALLEKVLASSPGKAVVVTFKQSPQAHLFPQRFPGYLYSLNQRLEVFNAMGIDLVCLIDFSPEFGRMSGKDFIGLIQERLKLRYLAIGSNFRCGYGLDTDVQRISELNSEKGIQTDILPPVFWAGEPVSSSRIRTAIARGDLVEATELFGRDIVLDVSDVPTTPGPTWIDYNVGAAKRIAPPPGRYSVLIQSIKNQCSTGTVEIAHSYLRLSGPRAKRLVFKVEQ